MRFIFIAVPRIDWANFQPFMPYGFGSTETDGMAKGVMAAAALIFFAYIGFDAVSTGRGRNTQSESQRADRIDRLADHLHECLRARRRWGRRHHALPGARRQHRAAGIDTANLGLSQP